MPKDLAELLTDEAFLQDLSRLAALVEAHQHSLRPLSVDEASHLQDLSHGLAVICARKLDQSYGSGEERMHVGRFKPRMVVADATHWTKDICQELGISAVTADVVFQDWFFGSVITAFLKSQLRQEEWNLIDSGSIRKWVYADLQLFLAE